MKNSSQEINLYRSEAHQCSYLDDQQASSLFIDPDLHLDINTYTFLVENGFRRSGSHVYKPFCHNCSSCIALRLDVNQFEPKRSQKRCQKANQNLQVKSVPAKFNREHYLLYEEYLRGRHLGGGMDDTNEQKYAEFLISDWSITEFIEFRDRGKLIAIAVTDVLNNGLSAVYTFFSPASDYRKSSLGVNAILWQINETKRRGLKWLYLGYWIPQNRKMSYKNQYQPAEYYWDGRWHLNPPQYQVKEYFT